jgi:hypothetical protein
MIKKNRESIKEIILFSPNLMHQHPVPNEAFSILFFGTFPCHFERAIRSSESLSCVFGD